MTEKTPLLAWHGDPDLKEQVMAKMKQHRVQDEFIQGNYQILDAETASGYKGCALGCTLELRPSYISVGDTEWGDNAVIPPELGWHQEVQSQYGIDRRVAHLIDTVFEAQEDYREAGDFAVAVIEAIPIGADLQFIHPLFIGKLYDDDMWSPKAKAQTLIDLLAKAPVPEPVA